MGVSSIYNKGDRFYSEKVGWCEILEYKDKFNVIVKFDNTGGVNTVTTASIRARSFKDRLHPTLYGIGYIGYGEYCTRVCNKKTKAYIKWSHMLSRCYDKSSKDYSSYGGKGVYVQDSWHNFQNFAKWFYNQPNHTVKGIHIDKDFKVLGSTCYSEDTCSLIPAEFNTLQLHSVADTHHRTSSGSYRFNKGSGKLSKSYKTHDLCHKEYIKYRRVNSGEKILKLFDQKLIPLVVFINALTLLDDNFPPESSCDKYTSAMEQVGLNNLLVKYVGFVEDTVGENLPDELKRMGNTIRAELAQMGSCTSWLS